MRRTDSDVIARKGFTYQGTTVSGSDPESPKSRELPFGARFCAGGFPTRGTSANFVWARHRRRVFLPQQVALLVTLLLEDGDFGR